MNAYYRTLIASFVLKKKEKSSVADPWHFGVDPDPGIHASVQTNYFCLMIERSVSGSIPLTNGSGSRRPKNTDPQHWKKVNKNIHSLPSLLSLDGSVQDEGLLLVLLLLVRLRIVLPELRVRLLRPEHLLQDVVQLVLDILDSRREVLCVQASGFT